MIFASSIYSAYLVETSNIHFEKMNRRIEHITNLKADTSKNYSEPFMVRVQIQISSINHPLNITTWTIISFHKLTRIFFNS